MQIERIDIPTTVPGAAPGSSEHRPANPKEAAEQFEQVLVKQMVQVMTKDLFKGSLSGDEAPQWMGAYSDMQSDVLATELAKKMTENGRLGIAELLMKQWSRTGQTPEDAPAPESTEEAQ